MGKKMIIDGNAEGYRALFTTGDLEYKETKTGVLFGFFSRLINISEVFKSNSFIFAWDSRKSYRKIVYPAYKGKRHQDMTEEEKEKLFSAYEQMNLLYDELLPRIGFSNNFKQTGIEGDDIIGVIVKDIRYIAERFFVFASDMDLYQLLSENCTMVKSRGEIFNFYGKKEFIAEFGIEPRQWVKVKQIAGCTTDEVPGCGRDVNNPKNIIARIGEKTAVDYIKGVLKGTTKALKRIDSAEGQQIVEFNKQLVKLPHPKTKKIDLQPDKLNKKEFINICREFGFKKIYRERLDEVDRMFAGDWE